MIQDGSLPADRALPSERELSEMLSASRGVIRAAIRELSKGGYVRVKPRCRPVVVEGAELRRSENTTTKHIGIWLWPNANDFVASSILKGIQSAGFGSDVRLTISSACGMDWSSIFDDEAEFLESMAKDPCGAGLIIWYLGAQRNIAALQRLRNAGLPMVFVDRLPPEELNADFVGSDNEAGARRAVQHLIELGHRNIALVSNIDPVSSVQDRETGYRRALREAGIPVNENYIQKDLLDSYEGAEAALRALFALPEPPTAIFAVNDLIALQIYEILQNKGVSIPSHISVVGFDGLLRWVPGGGYLTTCIQDFQRMGQIAAEIMVQRLEGGSPSAFKHVLLDSPLSDRGSTAPPTTILVSPMSSMENINNHE